MILEKTARSNKTRISRDVLWYVTYGLEVVVVPWQAVRGLAGNLPSHTKEKTVFLVKTSRYERAGVG